MRRGVRPGLAAVFRFENRFALCRVRAPRVPPRCSVPTIPRTMCRKKAFAVISNPIRLPSCHHAARSTVRTVVRPASSCVRCPEEAREIVRPDQAICRGLHRREVQPISQVPGPAPQPEVRQAVAPDQIAIVTAKGRPPCVELGRRLSRAVNEHVIREVGVGRPQQLRRREPSPRREADHLATRVDTGVGPTRPPSRVPAPRAIGRAPLLAPPESSVRSAGDRTRDTVFPRTRGPAGCPDGLAGTQLIGVARAPAPPGPSAHRRPCGASA